MDFGKSIEFWEDCIGGIKLLYLVVLRAPVCLIYLRIVISLFLRLLVVSFLSALYVLVSCSSVLVLLVQSSLSMMTISTPMSAVRTTLDVSCFSCVRALHCVGLMLHLVLCWVCCCLSNLLTSDLNSSATWDGSFEEVCSTAVMWASMGVLGGYGKLGLFSRRDNCSVVRGILDRLMTHILVQLVVVHVSLELEGRWLLMLEGAMDAESALVEGVGSWVWQGLLVCCWLKRKYLKNWMAHLGVCSKYDLG